MGPKWPNFSHFPAIFSSKHSCFHLKSNFLANFSSKRVFFLPIFLQNIHPLETWTPEWLCLTPVHSFLVASLLRQEEVKKSEIDFSRCKTPHWDACLAGSHPRPPLTVFHKDRESEPSTDTGLWLAKSDHMTWILASDWMIWRTLYLSTRNVAPPLLKQSLKTNSGEWQQ